ncbi:hypothetical protein SAMN05444352_103125 [Pseudomonas japonica]|uniref:Uncharacterized protein n=1 Tax=Pseudomonas japonica TaxID=256466 RepID=A0A239BQM2_9PSED|nr:hypothetical protein SAMN05444352_103125 [Pseudomonas japonica]
MKVRVVCQLLEMRHAPANSIHMRGGPVFIQGKNPCPSGHQGHADFVRNSRQIAELVEQVNEKPLLHYTFTGNWHAAFMGNREPVAARANP